MAQADGGDAEAEAQALAPVQPPPAASPPPEAPRLHIVRVKRKRTTEAAEDLVIEGLAAPSKRPHTLTDALERMGLRQAAATDGAAANGDAADSSTPAPCRRHFRRLATLSARQLSTLDQTQLQQLLSQTRPQQQRAQQPQQGRGAAAAAAAERAQHGLQAGQTARYEQVMRRRGASASGQAQAAADPLQSLAQVHDVVRRDTEEEQGQHARQLGQRGRCQQAGPPYEEGTLLCNYLPMVREYLQQQQSEQTHWQQQQALAAGAAGAGGAAGLGCSGEEGGEAGDEFVYDLYFAASDAEEPGEELEDGCSGRRAPVVHILNDETWLVLEGSDSEGAADSEDSNAEGYYANEYPDEELELSSSEEEEGSGSNSQGRRARGGRGWDNESYGSSAQEDWF